MVLNFGIEFGIYLQHQVETKCDGEFDKSDLYVYIYNTRNFNFNRVIHEIKE